MAWISAQLTAGEFCDVPEETITCSVQDEQPQNGKREEEEDIQLREKSFHSQTLTQEMENDWVLVKHHRRRSKKPS